MPPSASDNPQAGQGRPLPKKEADLFKNVVKFYESKQYKKGLKNADTILKRYPMHGETLCMKGLIVNAMAAAAELRGEKPKKGEEEGDKKKEAVELVKKGLMMDMRSHVCWHVYGLLHRASHNYPEAVKAYKQALKIDPENLQILRDMGLLQIQMRDVAGFRDTRLRILTLRPNSKVHWLSYAVACHANGDAEGTVGVIDSYMGTLEKDSVEFQRNFDSSELALYKNQVLAETAGGDDGLAGVTKALAHLDEIQSVVVDQTGWLSTKLSYQLQLGRFDDAAATVMTLFERGSTEDHKLHGAYMCALLNCDRETCTEVGKLRGTGTLATWRPLAEAERTVLLRAYGENKAESLAAKFPRSAAIKRIRLTLLPTSGEEFQTALDAYCRRQILKGVPSLGSDLSSLYLMEKEEGRYVLAEDPVDVQAHAVYQLLVKLVDSYVASLASNDAFPNDDEASPSALLWAWYLRSVLHEQAAEYAEGLSLIDKCIEHTPTAVDFYELKARLLEKGGDVQRAATVVDAGRDLDHQDRYINNQTTKTMLRAGREEDARKLMSLFTRHEGNPEQNLYDMQCTWYELELADCWRHKGELGRSLRKYAAVIKHYEDFHEDQFDFHMYCIRKVTLRSYCKLLKFEDELWGLPQYGRAAEEVIKLHLHLIDNPAMATEDAEPDYSKMTPAERKKAKNIARKKAKKAAAAVGGGGDAKESNGSNNNSGNKKKAKPHVIDEDPEGKELLALDHLAEAKKHASLLVRHAPRRLSAWALQYDVSMRRGKALMALRALFQMRSIDPGSDALFSRIVDFAQTLAARPAEARGHAVAEGVIASEFPALTNDQSLSDFVKGAVEGVKADSSSSLPMRIAAARAMLSADIGYSPSDAAGLILESKLDCRGVSIATCKEALAFMDSLGGDCKEQLQKRVAEKFPFAKDC